VIAFVSYFVDTHCDSLIFFQSVSRSSGMWYC